MTSLTAAAAALGSPRAMARLLAMQLVQRAANQTNQTWLSHPAKNTSIGIIRELMEHPKNNRSSNHK